MTAAEATREFWGMLQKDGVELLGGKWRKTVRPSDKSALFQGTKFISGKKHISAAHFFLKKCLKIFFPTFCIYLNQ